MSVPNAPVLVLKEETDTRFGKNQIVRNIEVCEKIAEILRSTLGPNGMDKMFFSGSEMVITNDGATIMKSLQIVHPAGKVLLSIAESQDRDIGDGTTSVILLAAAILSRLKPLVKENLPVTVMLEVMDKAMRQFEAKAAEQRIPFNDESLRMLAETSLNSKILSRHKKHFGEIVLSTLDVEHAENIGIKKVPGGSVESSFVVNGIAFEKCFTYAGYEQQPKRICEPLVALLKVELEWKSEADNAEARISGAEEYEKIVSAEWKLITDRLLAVINSGAKVVLSTLSIGDYATQFFAKHGVFSAGRVPEAEINRIIATFGGRLVSTVGLLSPRTLASCALFEEKELGRTRFNVLSGDKAEGPSGKHHMGSKDGSTASLPRPKACTIILRGPGKEILAEVERSLHDSMAVTRRTASSKEIVAGGGAFEMEISRELREFAGKFSCSGKFVMKAISEAFEVVPFQLARNFGLDAIHTVQLLRKAHHEGLKYHGVAEYGIQCSSSALVLEPLQVKLHMAKAAIAAASAIVSIDSTIISGSDRR